MKVLPILVLSCLCSCYLFGQQPFAVKGSLTDSAAGIKLTDATISVLRAKDSTLCKFTWNSTSHSFHIPLSENGHFLLLITYPGYADYTAAFSVDETQPVYDFHGINMLLKSRLLTEVLIEGRKAAMKIRGDTTEYDATAFKVQPNAKVEDLLKQFPGVSVDKDGKITAQGKTVNKVLVDGEEFFGDDPTLVTKNIRADMVDKVQLYDGTSEQSKYTGIDDGKKEKTINLKLKEDKKNGYFGKLEAGGGTDKFYRGQGMFNAFKGKQRVSVFGLTDNTGKLGMNWNDNNKYGMSNMNISSGEDGSMRVTMDQEDELESWNGSYNEEGIPLARTGGIHYDNKFNNDLTSVNANYRIGELSVDGVKSNEIQNVLPTSSFTTRSDQAFHNYLFRHKGNGRFEFKLDTTSSLIVTASGLSKNTQSSNIFDSKSYRPDSSLLNTNDRKLNNRSDQAGFSAGLLYSKKLNSKGRRLTINLNESYSRNNGSELLQSNIQYYNDRGAIDSSLNNDQQKRAHTTGNTFSANAAFKEPLSKRMQLALTYDFIMSNANSDQQTFNKSGEGKYDAIDSLLSNDFKMDNFSHQGGAMLTYKGGKHRLSAGTKVATVAFDQLNRYTNTTFNRNFVNWNPSVNWSYEMSQAKAMSLVYNRRTRLPTINQLQPVRTNTDPLNIREGNPDLKPTNTDEIWFNISSYKLMTQRYVYLNAGYTIQHDAIVSNVTTDSSGASRYQFANISKPATSGSIYLNYQLQTSIWNIVFGSTASAHRNVSYNLVNSVLNKTNAYDFSQELNLRKWVDKKYTLELSASPGYVIQQSSLMPDLNSNGFNMNVGFEVQVYLPKGFECYSQINHNYRAKTKTFNTDLKRTIWNMNVSKTFLKEKQLRVTASVNDLLNQNIGYNRSAYGSQIVQNTYTTIRRYLMFTASWDFNKMGGTKAKTTTTP
jgi:hypothetical protein